jgi:hypothetical protein
MTRRSTSRITHVTLRRGTRYRIIEGDRLSEHRVVERGVEVEVRRLALAPGEVAAYVLDRNVLLVAYDDEVRAERTA